MTGIRRVTASSRLQSPLPEPWSGLLLRSTIEVLDNGLTLIAHRDRKAPLVGVYIVYHVGSRDEPAGKNGLSHLFEHLMYCGTDRFPGSTFRHLEKIGATAINAISRADYTAYFATVPKEYLDQALAIEAARMQSNRFDQVEFDRQREVVRNELLQREGEPYGSINRVIAEHAYPQDHPYSHPADGTIAGLDRLSLNDATSWYRAYYRPANAALVIAGDVAPEEAIERARRHFGELRNGVEVPLRPAISLERLSGSRRVVVEERTEANRLHLVWNVPPFATPEYPGLELLAEILTGGSASWLSRCLVEEAKSATAIGGESRPREFGSQVVLWANGRQGVSFKQLREEVDSAIGRLADAPLSKSVIDHTRARFFARLARDTERLCGSRSQAELLGTSWIMSGDPGAHEKRIARIASITSSELRELARAWLDTKTLVIEARGSQAHRISDRARKPPHRQPSLQRVAISGTPTSTSSSRPLVLRREGSPVCAVHTIIEGGSKEDPEGRSGLAAVAISALSDTAARHRGTAITMRLEQLSASIENRVLRDGCVVRLSSLASNAVKAIELLHDLLHRKSIEAGLVECAKARQIAAIQGEKSRPFDLAMRLMPTLLYGSVDRYARPPYGDASEVAQITTAEVAALISRWRTASPKRVVVVGLQNREALTSLGERLDMSSAQAKRERSDGRIVLTATRQRRVLMIHAPERAQTAIFAARAIGPRGACDFAAIAAADTILGGSFSSRLNMNLREDKGWTYGARSVISTWRAAGLWAAYTFVEPARAVATMGEVEREWQSISKVTASELADAAAFMIRRTPGELETTAQLAAAAEDLIIADLPRSWHRDLHVQLRTLCPRDIADACTVLQDRPLAWVILGDAASLVPMIEQAGFGAVEVIGDLDSIR